MTSLRLAKIDCRAKCLRGFGCRPAGKQIHPPLADSSTLSALVTVTAFFRIKVEASFADRRGTRRYLHPTPMKSHTEYLVFETKKRREMVHITDEVEQIVKRSGMRDGLCFVSPMHITAAIYVNDLENGLIDDIGNGLKSLPPRAPITGTTRPAKTTPMLT